MRGEAATAEEEEVGPVECEEETRGLDHAGIGSAGVVEEGRVCVGGKGVAVGVDGLEDYGCGDYRGDRVGAGTALCCM